MIHQEATTKFHDKRVILGDRRQEGWGGTPDLNGEGKDWIRHHDKYDA